VSNRAEDKPAEILRKMKEIDEDRYRIGNRSFEYTPLAQNHTLMHTKLTQANFWGKVAGNLACARKHVHTHTHTHTQTQGNGRWKNKVPLRLTKKRFSAKQMMSRQVRACL